MGKGTTTEKTKKTGAKNPKDAKKVESKKDSKPTKQAPKPSSDESSEESSEESTVKKTPQSKNDKQEVKKTNEPKSKTKKSDKKNGVVAKKADSSSSDSSSESDSSEPTPNDETTEVKAKAENGTASKKPGSESDSSSESSQSDEEVGKAKQVLAQKTPTKGKEASSDSSDSSADSDAEMEDKSTNATKGKRKADDEDVPPAKKARVETEGDIKTLFVGQLSWNVDNDWLQSEFAEIGEVVSARVQMDRQSGKSRGFGYVEFATAEAANAALEKFQGKEIDGRAIKLDLSGPKPQANPAARAKQFGDVASPPTSTLFIGNISWNTNEDMLWEHFSQYGQVSSCRVPTERESGRPKGFGYVEFADIDSAKKALEGATGSELDGRAIRLDYSAPKGEGGGGGGGRGGFGGGGRGGFGGGRGGGDRGRGRGGRGGPGGGRGGRGAPRGGARTGGITSFEGKRKTFG